MPASFVCNFLYAIQIIVYFCADVSGECSSATSVDVNI